MEKSVVLVTGGAGYIGSHTVRLLKDKYDVIIFDSLFRGNIESVPQDVKFVKGDLLDKEALNRVFTENKIDSVIHFAGLAYVGESSQKSELYYNVNVNGSFNLFAAMSENGVKEIVFSSTCSIYGNSAQNPIDESQPPVPSNRYGQTKRMVELLLKDFELSYNFRYVSLRYFNAAGCSPTGEIGEKHTPEPHLIPVVVLAALTGATVSVFGNDYNTPDGTCIRDFIHVCDLATAHISALDYLKETKKSEIFNLGSGTGYSVLEIIKKVEELTGLKVKYNILGRREGDPAVLIASSEKAANVLNWKPEYNLDDMILTAFNWFKNPKF
ncbi:MAG: UDP-glucose 4-epimerase GalE [Ignavibacteriaceae bacterium]|nr:UDP-glucose 4-epimerase GalE [Ignavibacteriaceae bacterium]